MMGVGFSQKIIAIWAKALNFKTFYHSLKATAIEEKLINTKKCHQFTALINFEIAK